jgi:hypothetical protein
MPVDMAARLFIEHGATIIPATGKEPLAIAAPMFLLS